MERQDKHKELRTKQKKTPNSAQKQKTETSKAKKDTTVNITQGGRLLFYGLAFLVFAGFAYWLLAVKNVDYLYAVQEHSLWVRDTYFWDDRMMSAGGFAQWLGCYFTQFFYYPWAGALLLILFWAFIYVLLIAAFQHRNPQRVYRSWMGALAIVPLFALLLSEVDMGYWLYYLKMPGYWFTQPISIFLALLATFGFSLLPDFRRRKTVAHCSYILLSTLVLYPLVGAWALVAVVWMAIHATMKEGRGAFILWGGAAISMLIPLFYYQFYTRMRIEDAWTVNFPFFQNDVVTSIWLTVPFIIVAVWPVFVALCRIVQRRMTRPVSSLQRSSFVTYCVLFVLMLIGLCLTTDHYAYDNYNYKAEMRIYKAVDESRWNDVLTEMKKAPGDVTRQMVISKNIALMHLGTCGDNIFRYQNSGEPPYVFDSLRVHLVQTCGTQLYYNYGKCNFACRWAIENAVEFGYNVDQLKMLVRTSMMSGEYKAAQKYLNVLHNTTFQDVWAEKWQAMLNDRQLYIQSTEYKDVYPMTLFNNTLDGDEGLCEMYIINYFSHVHKQAPKIQEQTLVFSLIQKDIQLFWPRFFQYATLHEQEQMPIHYQEAAYLYGHLENEVDISNMPFDEERVVARYASFNQITQRMLSQGMDPTAVGQATKESFGDTFWWFYFFCRDIHSY